MHALQKLTSIAQSTCNARTLGLALAALPLLITVGCSRDELAPDCSLPDCSIPNPGGEDPVINCELLPDGAVGADYAINLNDIVVGGSGNFNSWSISGLPDTLSVDAATGQMSGVPTEPMAYPNVMVSAVDIATGAQFEATCDEVVINEALNAFRVLMEPNHCIPHTASMDEMLALLDGGDGSEITCSALNDTGGTCPLGDGNGRLAPGISFNESSCTHSGSIAGDRRGTWVWMVELNQSGYTTRVPFCATNDVDTFHDINVIANSNNQSDLVPGLLEYSANEDLSFGSGSYEWTIVNPACPGPDCNTYGFRFNVSCSPFDVDNPWQITLSPSQGTETGLIHEMTATGPAPDPKFDGRPWVASFEISYCTSADGGFCDTANADQFEQNAQTQYHFDVVGFPTL